MGDMGDTQFFTRSGAPLVSVKRFKVRTVALTDRGYRVGQSHHLAKLSDADVEQILDLRETYRLSYAAIAAKFDDLPGGLSKEHVRDICLGRARSLTPHRFASRMVVEVDDDGAEVPEPGG